MYNYTIPHNEGDLTLAQKISSSRVLFWVVVSLAMSCTHTSTSENSVLTLVPDSEDLLVMSTRAPGTYGDGEYVEPLQEHTLEAGEVNHTMVQGRMIDFQTQSRTFYRGYPLENVIGAYKAEKGLDVALLHFSNNMIIPVPSQPTDPYYKKVRAILAVETSADGKSWTRNFQPLSRKDDFLFRKDPMPITFTKNKMVVSGEPIPHSEGQRFSPWHYVASLESIEFVNSAAYYGQFAVQNDKAVQSGLTVYRQRCQYCHSARQVGAGFGWDYVKPLPIYEKRTPDNIYTHVRYEKLDKMSTAMPAQTDFTKENAEHLWKWMKAVAEQPLKPYAPAP